MSQPIEKERGKSSIQRGEWRINTDTDHKIIQGMVNREIRGFTADRLVLYYKNIEGEPDPVALSHSQLMISIVNFNTKRAPMMKDFMVFGHLLPGGDVYIGFAISPQGSKETLNTSRPILIDAANEIIKPLTGGQNLIPLPPENISST